MSIKMEEHKALFKTDKPIIGCVHFMPLPGTPHYNPAVPIKDYVTRAVREAKALKEAGFDAIIFANEGDRPYLFNVGPKIIAAYTRIATEVIEKVDINYGCGVLMDTLAAISIAKALEAKFIRAYISGTYSDTFGFHEYRPGDIYRSQKNIDATEVKIYCYFAAHCGIMLDNRGQDVIVDDSLGVLEPAGVLVTDKAGTTPDFEIAKRIKQKHPEFPVLITSGLNEANIRNILPSIDGCVVGTSLKKEGVIWNELDPARAQAFIKAAHG
jgi:membrane complex biogenesis BtpA family protein